MYKVSKLAGMRSSLTGLDLEDTSRTKFCGFGLGLDDARATRPWLIWLREDLAVRRWIFGENGLLVIVCFAHKSYKIRISAFLPCDAMRCTVLVIVILSVCPSVTLVHCVHMVRPTIMISSPNGSPIILVSGDIKFIPKFEGDHPERWR